MKRASWQCAILFVLASWLVFVACGDVNEERDVVTVTFDARDGNATNLLTVTVKPGGTVRQPADPVLAYRDFDGWYTEPACLRAWDFTLDTVQGDMTLYAKWLTNQWTLTYAGNGHTGGNPPALSTLPAGHITLASNSGFLVKLHPGTYSLAFKGWNSRADGNGVDHGAGSPFIITSNTTLYAVWQPFQPGDPGPAGGWVFFDQGGYVDGWRYLEAAPADQSTGKAWASFGSNNGTSVMIGAGFSNTANIITHSSHLVMAASLCADLVLVAGAVYDDWFMPSREELRLLYLNLKPVPAAGLHAAIYWSSSETNFGFAWGIDFSQGGKDHPQYKDQAYRVRAVRRF